MREKEQKPRPGDGIIDCYMPDATPEEREEAHENLRRLARVLIRIEDRLAREWYERQSREDDIGAVESETQVSSQP